MGDYICNGCKSKFEEHERVQSYLADVGMAPVYETLALCPNCGSDDTEEAYMCQFCMEWFAEGDMSDEFDCVCINCVEEIDI